MTAWQSKLLNSKLGREEGRRAKAPLPSLRSHSLHDPTPTQSPSTILSQKHLSENLRRLLKDTSFPEVSNSTSKVSMINNCLLFQLKSHCIFWVHKWKTTKHCEMRKSSPESQQITRAPRRPGNTLEARECCFGIKDTF